MTKLVMAQTVTANTATDSSNIPLYLQPPDYPISYGKTTIDDITKTLNSILDYLKTATPLSTTSNTIKASNKINTDNILKSGDFKLVSYEWGVTYAGMLLAGKVTGDSHFVDYSLRRLELINDLITNYGTQVNDDPDANSQLWSVLEPKALDDAGSMCAAMIKATRFDIKTNLSPLIENYIDYISNKQFRLPDGTLARNRPMPETLWLDDLFMSVPALAQMGERTGEMKYFDDAIKQVLQFSNRMFNDKNGLFMHGWVRNMEIHPKFYWARANGWALMAMVELLDVLPKDYPGRDKVMILLREHIQGLASYQSGKGFWHQLIDREDSYLETSATAIFTFSIARAINRGWIDKRTFGPTALLAWNAVSTKVNNKGQVEGTCVGTGMAFDPVFYYYRPTSVYAAHGYGPVLLAGAEMIELLRNNSFEINDGAIQFISK